MLFYLRLVPVILWLLICCTLWTIRALFSWGNPHLFARSVNFLGKPVLWLLGLKVDLRNGEHFKNHPVVLISNHQSALDVALIGAICPPDTVPVGKKEIAKVPFIGWWYAGCGGRLINRQNRSEAVGELEKLVDFILKKKISIGIMPEGTRNKDGNSLLPFKKGAFHLAIQAQVPIVAMVVAPLSKIANWKSKKLVGATIPIQVLPPFPTKGLTEQDIPAFIEKVRTEMLAVYNALGQGRLSAL